MEVSNIITSILCVVAFYFTLIRPILKKQRKDEINSAYLLGIARMMIHSDRRKGKALPLEESWKYRKMAERFDAEILKKEFSDESGRG